MGIESGGEEKRGGERLIGEEEWLGFKNRVCAPAAERERPAGIQLRHSGEDLRVHLGALLGGEFLDGCHRLIHLLADDDRVRSHVEDGDAL